MCFSVTCVCEELGGLQDLLCVDSRFIIVHFRSDHMDDSGSTASNCPSSTIQTVNIFLLKSDDTLIHILQDVVLWRGKTVMQLAVYTSYFSNTPSACLDVWKSNLKRYFKVFQPRHAFIKDGALYV